MEPRMPRPQRMRRMRPVQINPQRHDPQTQRNSSHSQARHLGQRMKRSRSFYHVHWLRLASGNCEIVRAITPRLVRCNTPSPNCGCYTSLFPKCGESFLEFHPFDAEYVESLCAGDAATEEHFVRYFTSLLNLKLRSRLRSPQAIEDVRQETFTRVLTALRRDKSLRNPERLGAFVNTVCNNVLLEHYRASNRYDMLEDEEGESIPANGRSVFDEVLSGQLKAQVGKILKRMPPRDRAILQAIFLEERDRDEVCRDFNVDSDYLRVLLFRAKQTFKTEYLKQIRTGLSEKNH